MVDLQNNASFWGATQAFSPPEPNPLGFLILYVLCTQYIFHSDGGWSITISLVHFQVDISRRSQPYYGVHDLLPCPIMAHSFFSAV